MTKTAKLNNRKTPPVMVVVNLGSTPTWGHSEAAVGEVAADQSDEDEYGTDREDGDSELHGLALPAELLL